MSEAGETVAQNHIYTANNSRYQEKNELNLFF